jgi:cell surface protein SprA
LSENNMVLGLGYRTNRFRFPFGLFRQIKMDNNMDFKLETAIRDNKTMIYRADVNEAEVSAGAKNITMRPSVNYILNSRFNFQFYYDTNINKPYTSAAFRTSSSNIGFSLRMTMN